MSLVQLLYVSSATSDDLQDEELLKILDSSVSNNTKLGITGMLLYSRGTFMQVLEGSEEAINEVYRRICQDPRHHNVQTLYRDKIQHRDFPQWSMGFRKLGPSDAVADPAYVPLFDLGFNIDQLVNHHSIALEMLRNFSKT